METASKLQLDSRVVGEMSEKLRATTDWLFANSTAWRIFQAVEEGHGKASGWSIAKTLGMQAEEAQDFLKQLKDNGLVDSTDAGLDGFYYLTKLGFALRAGTRVAV
jgi:predicted transcriptional regulator